MEFIKNIPAKTLVPGLDGHYTHGDNLTLGLVTIKAGTSLSLHQHVHEQITYMIKGRLDMLIGDTEFSLTAGTVQVIPSMVMHGALAVTDCELIDVFTPVREDYRKPTKVAVVKSEA